MIKEAEVMRARLSWAQSLMYQLESASSSKNFAVGRDLYNRIRGVYKELVVFRETYGVEGLKLVVQADSELTNLINIMARDFIRPIPEEDVFDYKQRTFSKKLNDTIVIVRQNIVYRGKYQHNVDGFVTYHEQEGVLINSSNCSETDLKAIHLVKKIFDGDLLSINGIENPDIPSNAGADPFGGMKRGQSKERPTLDVIKLEFSDTRE
jgi:hypothetical protein